MSDIAIRVEGLGKQYRIGTLQRTAGRHHYGSLRESIGDALATPFRHLRTRLRSAPKPNLETDTIIWALKDVSLEIKRGEVVGIIGRNGAGKSTLLKILSRITEPTRGVIDIFGRVSSLLEVGTGFHPELTGRDNVYLNGSILGMKKAEIDRRFDEIVAFSGVEKFLDTPVKRYSSGMQVRLAFAVAAHLAPEILLVDEVLAVGDAGFRNKCMGKMGEVARGGRTILLVSHDMAAIESLCTKAILIRDGEVALFAQTREVIDDYLRAVSECVTDVDLTNHPRRVSGSKVVSRRFRILDEDGRLLGTVPVGSTVKFELTLESRKRLQGLLIGIHLYNHRGTRVGTYSTYCGSSEPLDVEGRATLICTAPRFALIPGIYSAVLSIWTTGAMVDKIDPVAVFEVVPHDFYGTGRTPYPKDGVFMPEMTWVFTHD